MLHMCEVVPDDALSELALNVLEGSLEMGWDEAYGGGILYMMDVLGKPMVDATVTKDGKLVKTVMLSWFVCWPSR